MVKVEEVPENCLMEGLTMEEVFFFLDFLTFLEVDGLQAVGVLAGEETWECWNSVLE